MNFPFKTTPPTNPDRTKYIGGSDIGVLLGMNDRKTPYQLWEEFTGLASSFDAGLPAKVGTVLEDMILDQYEQYKGFRVVRQQPFYHNDYPFFAGTADGVGFDGTNFFGVDAKYSGSYFLWKNGPPPHVVAQMNWYGLLSGIKEWDIALLNASRGCEMVYMTIHTNDELQKVMVNVALDFWDRVQNGEPPEPESYADILKIYPHHEHCKIETVRDCNREKALRFFEVKKQLLELQSEYDSIKDDLTIDMKDAEVLEDEEGNRIFLSVERKGKRVIRVAP